MASHPTCLVWELHTPLKLAELVKFYRLYNLCSHLIRTAERGKYWGSNLGILPKPHLIMGLVQLSKSERYYLCLADNDRLQK